MSSLSDMVSAAIAGLLSAALVHFGATDANDKAHKTPPGAHAQPATGRISGPHAGPSPVTAPIPADDDRFATPNPDAVPSPHPDARHANPAGHAA